MEKEGPGNTKTSNFSEEIIKKKKSAETQLKVPVCNILPGDDLRKQDEL